MEKKAVTIDEAIALKQEAEERIAEIVVNLQNETGMKVTGMAFSSHVRKIGFIRKQRQTELCVTIDMCL